MDVFISWSGPRSRHVATALRDWLKGVIQAVRPWLSVEDIDKGARWEGEIASRLRAARAGIICVTRDNVDRPWLVFEAGAISKAIAEPTYAMTYLVDLEPPLQGPLGQFQATVANHTDTKRLVMTLNRALGPDGLEQTLLERTFGLMWPELERALAQIPSTGDPGPPRASERQLLEEILSNVRQLSRSANIHQAVKHSFALSSPLDNAIEADLIESLNDENWPVADPQRYRRVLGTYTFKRRDPKNATVRRPPESSDTEGGGEESTPKEVKKGPTKG